MLAFRKPLSPETTLVVSKFCHLRRQVSVSFGNISQNGAGSLYPAFPGDRLRQITQSTRLDSLCSYFHASSVLLILTASMSCPPRCCVAVCICILISLLIKAFSRNTLCREKPSQEALGRLPRRKTRRFPEASASFPSSARLHSSAYLIKGISHH